MTTVFASVTPQQAGKDTSDCLIVQYTGRNKRHWHFIIIYHKNLIDASLYNAAT